jgi:hypothetical protein
VGGDNGQGSESEGRSRVHEHKREREDGERRGPECEHEGGVSRGKGEEVVGLIRPRSRLRWGEITIMADMEQENLHSLLR